jgi:two-component system, NtrC family, sensor kinase
MEHMDNTNPPKDRKLLVLLLAGASLVFVFLAGLGLIHLASHNVLGKEQIEYRQNLGRSLASSIDATLSQSGAVVLLIARTTPFEQLQDNTHLGRVLVLLRKDNTPVFQDLGLIDQSGRQTAYAGPYDLLGADYGSSSWLADALTSEIHVSDLLLGQRKRPHFVLTGRFQHMGRPWLLKTSLDLEEVKHILDSLPLPKGTSAFIVNSSGAVQAYTDKSALPDAETAAALGRSLDQPSQMQAATGQFTYVVTPMRNGNWGLVLGMEWGPIAPDRQMLLWWALAAAAFGTLLIIGTMAIIFRTMRKTAGAADPVVMQAMNEQFIEAGKMASIGELAAGIAHEINNPIATMVEEAGWMEDLLQEDEELATTKNYQELRRALQQIKTQGARCKDITHKMLSFARKSDLRVQDIHLNNLIREVAALSEKRAKYASSHIVLNLDPEVPSVAASATEMQQVFLNLVNNALDAMEKTGGTITITTRRIHEMVEIHVEDTGEGIPKANLSRIFDPFYTTKPVGKGTGLGLSICYTIIKNMGGEISVTSQVGVGTTFTIRLPIGSVPEAGKQQANRQ